MTVKKEEFSSIALNKKTKYNVLLPNDFVKDEVYPMVVVLHGMGRDCNSIIGNQLLLINLLRLHSIVVFPDGENGCYINSITTPNSNYMDYIAEVISLINEDYNVYKEKEKRTIIGWSMGAFGAANYIINNEGSFGNFISIIGLLDYPNYNYSVENNYPLQSVFEDDVNCFNKYRAVQHIEKFKSKKIMIYAGSKAFDYQMNLAFVSKLKESNIAFTYIQENVGHEWQAVQNGMIKAVEFLIVGDTY